MGSCCIFSRELNRCVLEDLCFANLPDKMDSGVKVINRDILIICTSKEVSPRSDYEDPISEGKAYCDWLGTSSGGKVKYKKCQKLKMLLKNQNQDLHD